MLSPKYRQESKVEHERLEYTIHLAFVCHIARREHKLDNVPHQQLCPG